jgi:hypothetical protein
MAPRRPSRRRAARTDKSSNTSRGPASPASSSLHRRPDALGACQRQKASANGLRTSPPRRSVLALPDTSCRDLDISPKTIRPKPVDDPL